MRVLGLIPARGGSKELPGKNLRPLAGKSLVQRAFECAVQSGVVDRVVLSTDDPAIMKMAKDVGVEAPFVRPSEFARDDSPMIDVAVHALTTLRESGYSPDALLLLQPTSPLRTPEQIRKAIDLLGDNDSVCSVIALPKALCPDYMMKITSGGYLDYFTSTGSKYTRRQDIPQAYKREGTIFLTRSNVILDQRSFYGPRCVPMIISDEETLNIDDASDWKEAEIRLSGGSL